jgi:hypothetical protein
MQSPGQTDRTMQKWHGQMLVGCTVRQRSTIQSTFTPGARNFVDQIFNQMTEN